MSIAPRPKSLESLRAGALLVLFSLTTIVMMVALGAGSAWLWLQLSALLASALLFALFLLTVRCPSCKRSLSWWALKNRPIGGWLVSQAIAWMQPIASMKPRAMFTVSAPSASA